MSTVARFTISDYDRMIDAGVFEPKEKHRVELIRGEIREMSPIGSPHETIVDRLTAWGVRKFPEDQVVIRVQNSVGIEESESAPQPDFVMVRNRDYYYGRPEDRDVILLIEVSDSSLAYDRGEKAELYAEAGIQDYWIVNIPQRVVEVYRNPGVGRYQQLQTFGIGQSIAPLEFPEIALEVASLWAGVV